MLEGILGRYGCVQSSATRLVNLRFVRADAIRSMEAQVPKPVSNY